MEDERPPTYIIDAKIINTESYENDTGCKKGYSITTSIQMYKRNVFFAIRLLFVMLCSILTSITFY